MDATRDIAGSLSHSARVLADMAVDGPLCAAAARAASLTAQALRAGHKLLLCGNGGSAAEAQHWAAELVGRFLQDRPALAAIALATDGSALTCIGNDLGFEQVFARQIQALGQGGDVLFALSTSGNSPNVLAALAVARARGLVCVGFTGADGGDMAPLCDVLLRVPATEVARIQEGHAALGHAICAGIEAEIFPSYS
jgi:D-sedoheptulose 7-phosphate isomerase